MGHPRKEFMQSAIREALKAKQRGENAVGAIIVREDQLLARAYNSTMKKRDPLYHAEVVAIQKACRSLKSKYLENCWLYTTHEPCPMCASLMVWAKLEGVVFGAQWDDMMGASYFADGKQFPWRTIAISSEEVFQKSEPHKPKLIQGFMREECMKLFRV